MDFITLSGEYFEFLYDVFIFYCESSIFSFLYHTHGEKERESERVSTRERESHRQLNVGARTAEIIRLTIHQLVALCQLNQCKAAKDKILWCVCACVHLCVRIVFPRACKAQNVHHLGNAAC